MRAANVSVFMCGVFHTSMQLPGWFRSCSLADCVNILILICNFQKTSRLLGSFLEPRLCLTMCVRHCFTAWTACFTLQCLLFAWTLVVKPDSLTNCSFSSILSNTQKSPKSSGRRVSNSLLRAYKAQWHCYHKYYKRNAYCNQMKQVLYKINCDFITLPLARYLQFIMTVKIFFVLLRLCLVG